MTAVLEPSSHLKPETVDRAAEALRVYEEERAGLVRYAAKFAGGHDQGEDAVQDAFVRLLTDPAEVRNAAAYVTTQARTRALTESSRRGRQVPVGDAMGWQPDTAPPAEDLETLGACVGDPAVAAKVEQALRTLNPAQQKCVRMYCLDGKTAKQIGAELGIPSGTAYSRVTAGLANLERLGLKYDEGEHTMQESPTAPKRRGGVPTATDEQLDATLAREFPGQWIGPRPAEETLRRVHTKVSTVRAIAAQKRHNEGCVKPASKNRAAGTAKPRAGAAVAPTVAHAGTEAPPAPALSPVQPTVAEVWLLGSKPPISCMLVHTDETTTSRDLAAVSMPGAQREITGQLLGDGYRPDGAWVDIDPAGPESMRKFQAAR